MSEAAASSGFSLGAGIARALSDDRLAQRAVRGDDQAFAAIFRRYHQDLYRFCLAILGNPLDAQDALQNTMVKVLRALPGEERRIELKPWLFRIAHNESIELLRRRRETRQIDADLAALGPGLAEEAASRERLRRLISDLDELPERQRGALVMRELAGLDFAEIGAALGASAAVARQALYEARLSLRQMDQGRGMSCGAVSKALSDGDVRITRRRDVRAHLRDCASCRCFRDDIEAREGDFAALSPLPAVAAAGMLNGLLGGSGAGGGGLVAALGGGAANSIGAAGLLKGAALVALVGAIGVSVPDRGGLIHVELPGEGSSPVIQTQRPADVDQARGRSSQAIGPNGVGAQAGAAAGVGGGDRAGAAAGMGGDARAGASPTTKAAATGNAASPDAGTTGSEEAKTNVAADETKRNVAADETTTSPAADETTTDTAGAASTTQAASNGKGHTKELPSASDHGQQTAAAHKAEHGSAGTQTEAQNPSPPSHPAHPSNPSAENGPPPSPPGAAVREEHSQAPVAPTGSPAAEASPAHGKGKQP
jgi:RNA polymerase sigma factor (sigma-70 family)